MRVMREGRSFTVGVAADGAGLVSHAGAALLAEIADRTGLTRELSAVLAGLRERRGRHDPGRVIRDLAVMLADGGDCLFRPGRLGGSAGTVRPGGLDPDRLAGARTGRPRP